MLKSRNIFTIIFPIKHNPNPTKLSILSQGAFENGVKSKLISENLSYLIHLMIKKTLVTPIFMLYLHRITCQNNPIQWILNNLNADLILGIGFIPKTSCLYAKMAIHFQELIAIQP